MFKKKKKRCFSNCIYLGNLTSQSWNGAFSKADHAQDQNLTEEGRDELPVGDEISPQIRRKRLFSAQSGGGMSSKGFRGPALSARALSPGPPAPPHGALRDSGPGAEKPRLFANRRPLPPSGMYVRGPG